MMGSNRHCSTLAGQYRDPTSAIEGVTFASSSAHRVARDLRTMKEDLLSLQRLPNHCGIPRQLRAAISASI